MTDPLFGEVISSYSRAQAIDDGILVDVSEHARQVGIKFPVAMTIGAWLECVKVKNSKAWPDCEAWQDETGRLHDILWMLYLKIRGSKGSRIDYSVSVQRTARKKEIVKLYSLCGPGDQAEPVITIMLPGED